MRPQLERYEVLRLLGSGGMAHVYLVRHRELGTQHALKVLREHSPRLAVRLRQEGEIQRSLRHHNVLAVNEVVWLEDGQPALLMDYIVGPTLADLLGTGLPLEFPEIDALGRGILGGVAAAHARGWVHRDLKPSNVLLAMTGSELVPKVADFGLVKVLDDDGNARAGNTTRRGLGTQRYMSLEQLTGASVDKRMDVFALGAILYELIEGRPAFPTIADWEDAIRTDAIPLLRRTQIPERLKDTVVAAFSPRHARPEDATALLALWQDAHPHTSHFREGLLRIASIVADHLPIERAQQPIHSSFEAEHLSMCPRCRTQEIRARETAAPSTILPSILPEHTGPVLILSWVGDPDDEIRSVLVQQITIHNGLTVDFADGCIGIRFDNARDGYRFAVTIHRTLRACAASRNMSLAARIVLHTDIDTALLAALLSITHPGQTLASRGVVDTLHHYVNTSTEDEALLVSHGHWRLTDRHDTIELFEVGIATEAPGIAPVEGLDAWRVILRSSVWLPTRPVPYALPAELDLFVGRQQELLSLAARMRSGERLVTVHGTAGIGKTRLVLHYAWSWLGAWPGGVYFCDLSDARTIDNIVSVVARVLDVPLGKDDPVVQLGHALASRGRVLLILDNFEQLTAHIDATLARWMTCAEHASFLVTSRAVLGTDEEQVYALQPIDTEHGKVLFVERATAVRRDFDARQEADVIHQLVELLDGLPLAIELCAARVMTMRPSQMLSRMGERFRLIAGGRDRPGRQETLRAAIDWSYDLLEPWEQAALLQCSVFEGGFTLEAAEAMLDVSPFPGAPWAADLVTALLDRALLRSLPENRFGMLVSIQQYAQEKLSPAERSAAQARHGRYYAAFGTEEALDALDMNGGTDKQRRLVLEIDNLIAASRRATDDEEILVGATLAAWAVLKLRGPLLEGATLLERAAHKAQIRRSRVLFSAGIARQNLGQIAVAEAHYQAALLAAREAGDLRAEGFTLDCLGLLNARQGRGDEARAHYDLALSIARETSYPWLEAHVLGNLGLFLHDQGRLAAAREHYEAALAIAREIGNQRLEGISLGNLGNLAADQGRTEEAHASYQAALTLHRRLDNRLSESNVLGNLGILYSEQGHAEEASVCYEAALRTHREVGDRRNEGIVLGHIGSLRERRGQLDDALAHYEAALLIHREVSNPRFESQTIADIGSLLFFQGRMEEACRTLEAAIALTRSNGDRSLEGNILGNLGFALAARGLLDEARIHYDEALLIAREVGKPRNEALVLGNLGALLHTQGQLAGAHTCYEAALAIHRVLGDTRSEGHVLGHIGVLLAEQGQMGNARTLFDDGERLLRSTKDTLLLCKLLTARALAEHRAGVTDASLPLLYAAEQLANESGNTDSELGHQLAQARTLIRGSIEPPAERPKS